MAGLTKIETGGFAAGCALPSDATATTQSSGDNSTKIATTAYADAAGTNLDAAVTINESGNAVDFRVESDNNANALLVDGTNDRVGIGCTPGHPFEVRAGHNTHVICVSNTNGNDVIRLTSQDSSGDAEIIGFENSASGTHAEKFKINASGQSHFSGGNVGIGTTAPSTPLHIRKDDASEQTLIRLENLQSAGGTPCGMNIHFEIDNTNASNPQGEIAYLENGNDAYGDFIFRSTPQSNTTTMEDRHKMTANGRYVWAGRDCTTDFTSTLNAFEFRLNTGHHSNVGTMTLRSEDQLNADGDQVRFVVTDDNRSAVIGVIRSATNNKCGFINIVTDDGQNGILWVDNSDKLRISNSVSVVGSTGGTVVGDQTSDQRLKNSITDYDGGLNLITQLRPVNFKYNRDADGLLHAGFIAQEVQSVIPEAVYDTKDFLELRDENGDIVKRQPQDDEGNDIPNLEPEMVFQEDEPSILAMSYIEIIPALVNSIKELKTANDALTARVAALEAG